MESLSASEPSAQMINQVCPNPVDAEQIEREENYGNQRDNRRVLHLVRRGPRDTPHLGAGVPNKLPQASKESRRRRALFSAATAATRRQSSARCLLGRFSAR